MSLKHFHVIFIAIAMLACAGFGAWALVKEDVSTATLVTGVFSLVLAVVLLIYGVWFYRKSKKVIT